MTPEGKIKSKFNKKLLQLSAAYPDRIFRRMPVTRGMGGPLLDYILCIAGRFVAVEAKRDKDHSMTTQQINTMHEIEQAGGRVFLIYDDDTINYTVETLCRYYLNS